MANFDGTTGNDVLTGTVSADTINGFEGDDTIDGGDGADTLVGGDGGDTFVYTDTDHLDAGETINGGLGIDRLLLENSGFFDFRTANLTSLEQVVYSGGDGTQAQFNSSQIGAGLSSSAGIIGNSDPTINDFLAIYMNTTSLNIANLTFQDWSTTDNDVAVYGTAANEVFVGSVVGDTINANGGNNVLQGNLGRDFLIGGVGDDTFVYDSSAELVAGEIIDGSTGYDKIELNQSGFYNFKAVTVSGIDEIVFNDEAGGTVTLNSSQMGGGLSATANIVGSGVNGNNDGLSFDMDSAFIDLSGLTFQDWVGANRELRVIGTDDDQTILGSSIGDSLAVNGGDNVARGFNGDDDISASSGSNQLFGGNGNDSILGGRGTNLLAGGRGNDRVTGDLGVDTIYGNVGSDLLLGMDGDDVISGGGWADRVFGGAGNDAIQGDYGNDELNGGAGNDRVRGGIGQDVIYGGVGNDELFGDDGNDELYGEDGNDRVRGGIGEDMIHGGAGNDQLFGDGGNDNITGGYGLDVIHGGAGNDEIYGGGSTDQLYGDSGDDTIWNGGGNDTAYGGAGNDTIRGEGGDDRVIGNDGSDMLYGGSGTDLIIGGAGDDRLWGGDGATDDGEVDRFVIRANFGHDQIHDFENGTDIIDLTGSARFFDFADISANAVQSGSDILITQDAANTIRIDDMNLADLDATDFVFGIPI